MNKIKKHQQIICLFIAIFISSCELENNKPKEEETPKPFIPSAINVLKSTTDFTVFFDTAFVIIKNSNGKVGSIGSSYFTATQDNEFNAYFYTTTPTQQDEFFNYQKLTYNLNSKSENLISVNKALRFFPFSNLTLSDVVANHTYPALPAYGIDLSFRNPVVNHDIYGYFGKNMGGNFNKGTEFKMLMVASNLLYNELIKLRYIAFDVYKRNEVEEYYQTIIAGDSIKLFSTQFLDEGNANTRPNFINTIESRQKLNHVFAANVDFICKQYSIDGKKMSFAVVDNTSGTSKYFTFVIDFENKSIEQKLNNITLNYSGGGSDICIDIEGNLYYTGYANNGSNTNGVSIYKQTIGSQQPTLVGSDDFLVSGTITGINIFNQKIFLIVTAKQVGGNVHQISFIKQN